MSPKEAIRVLKKDSSLVKWLRYGRTVAFFNLYPACQQDLDINHLIWKSAQAGEYDPVEGNLLLENNLLSLALPRELHSFLAHTSQHDVNLCLLELLALIAEDEDEEGFALMQTELAEPVWKDLMQYMSPDDTYLERINRSTEKRIRLMGYVETLLNLCCLSPWKIEVYTAYISPQDMSTALWYTSNHITNFSDVAPESRRRALVRSAGRRPVTPPRSSPRPYSRVHVTNRIAVFWSLFQDWKHYRLVLVDTLGVKPEQASSAMLYSIGRGKQKEAWKRADCILELATNKKSLFSSLPADVIANVLYPFVLLAGSNA